MHSSRTIRAVETCAATFYASVFYAAGFYATVLGLIFVLSGCSEPPNSGQIANIGLIQNREPISLTTSDGHKIYGHLHRPDVGVSDSSSSPDEKYPLILAFHQGGSSGEAEYAPIIPRLLEEGYGVLTIDQRRGGNRFMGDNRTASAFDQDAVSYCEAIEDLEAALTYALSLEDVGQIIAWGSSYSATLAVELGANHPELISKVLAFSPASGEPMEGCNPLPLAFGLRQPALFLRPESELTFGSVAADMEAYTDMGHQIFIASPGAHGSSMLVNSRVDGETKKTWNTVLDFLRDQDQ
jgi:pimeloyl-ACP methyl ester carboxylesterase